MIPNTQLYPDILYDEGKRSVDWIVVCDNAVILAEVKWSGELRRATGTSRRGGGRVDFRALDPRLAENPVDRIFKR